MDKYSLKFGNDAPSLLTQNQLDIFLDAAFPLPENFDEYKKEALSRATEDIDDSTLTIESLAGEPIIYRGKQLPTDDLPAIVSLALSKVINHALESKRSAEGA